MDHLVYRTGMYHPDLASQLFRNTLEYQLMGRVCAVHADSPEKKLHGITVEVV